MMVPAGVRRRKASGHFIDRDQYCDTIVGMPKLPVLETVPTAQACCAPLSSAPLTAEDAAQLSMRLKALADPARLRMVSLLLVSETGELCTCDVTEPLGLSQPTISHHFKKLAEDSEIPYQTLINLYLRDCASSRRRLAMNWTAQRGRLGA
jgi:ArsR family transcriptional regulator